MRLLFAYGKERFFVLLLLIAWWLLYAVVFALYRLNLEAVLYAAVLGAVGTLTVAAVDFGLWLRRLRTLRELQNRVTLGLDGLPEPYGATEGAYQELLRSLYADRLTQLGAAGAREKDMVDYYTLWAHQIKTPIAAIHLLLQHDDSEQGREVAAELFKVEQYVEMVLQYLRLGGSSTDYLIAEVPLEPLVRQAVRKYAPLFIRSRVTLDLRPIHGSVLSDEKWLGFVVEQLLSNAVKYTRGGTVRILQKGSDLLIQDTGIGIAAEDLPRIFEKGYTGCNGRTDRKSTGIGLYLCKNVCDRLGHGIAVSSEIGRGTEVRLTLQRALLEVE
ncbi:MAG: HAMP domain-containing histidine kinase [Oscillospiraceae bacterium]|jgi:signal transduction histidine kinase|nr:HAMP domain-containing histidine kinase [Oscillospiraceae bacterium]